MKELLLALDLNELETKIALQCAPVLCGVKLANILIIPTINEQQTKELFQDSTLTLAYLFTYLDKSYYLLYQKEGLDMYLCSEQVLAARLSIGLKPCSLREMMHQIAYEYENCLKFHHRFPHEIGFLLGYPPQDVLGFIHQDGKNYLYCGYWKVYANLSMTLELFESYEKVKEFLLEYLLRGGHIAHILKNKEKR